MNVMASQRTDGRTIGHQNQRVFSIEIKEEEEKYRVSERGQTDIKGKSCSVSKIDTKLLTSCFHFSALVIAIRCAIFAPTPLLSSILDPL